MLIPEERQVGQTTEVVDIADAMRAELIEAAIKFSRMKSAIDYALRNLGPVGQGVPNTTLVLINQELCEAGLDTEQNFLSEEVLSCLDEMEYDRVESDE